MKLTDLEINCLEAILKFLDIENLLNAADANTRLRRAATLVFAREYDNIRWVIDELPRHPDPLEYCQFRWHYDDPFHPAETIDSYGITKRKIAFQLVRCFGSLLRSISCFCTYPFLFNTDLPDVECHFFNYVNEFCSETIGMLKLNVSNWDRTFLNFDKPFKQVELLCITNLTGSRSNTDPVELNCLNRLFPQMRSLVIGLRCSQFIHAGCVTEHFPNLEELSVHVDDCTGPIHESCDRCIESYRDTVRLNPQLKKIEFLSFDAAKSLIVYCAEHLQNIEHLDLNFCGGVRGFDRNSTIDALHFKNVKHLKARNVCGEWGFIRNYMDIVENLAFDHLETFALQVCHYEDAAPPPYDIQLKAFCERNQSLKRLTLTFLPDALETVLQFNSWLFATLPLLEELEFHLYNFNLNRRRGNATAIFVRKTITKILSRFDAAPIISINLACPLKIYCKENRYHYCDIHERFLNGFRDVWSVSWSDPKRSRLTFARRIDAD